MTREICLKQLLQEESYKEASPNHQKSIKRTYESATNEQLELIYFAALKESIDIS